MLQAEEPGKDAFMFSAPEYLDHLQALGAELETAMQIIARDSLVEFQESVARQEALTARLVDISNHLELQEACDHLYALPVGSAEIATQIRVANDRLQRLNRRYSALLRHSSHSVALMLSLFKSSMGCYPETSGSTLNRQSWSCQG